jgi:hypothetical protein
MPDSLTLSVMSQIVRKAGGVDPQPQPEPPRNAQPVGSPHLTDRQAVLLSELIHKRKHAGSPIASKAAGEPSQNTAGAMSLEALVKSTKNR